MSKLTNWQKFDNAFSQVSSYVVLDQDTMQVIAKVNIKHPKDGAGRFHGFIHVIGMEVQTSFVGGYGYDKRTAVITRTAKTILDLHNLKPQNINAKQEQFIKLLVSDDAQSGWMEVINYKNGFVV